MQCSTVHTPSITHAFTHTFTHVLTHALTHAFAHSPTHSLLTCRMQKASITNLWLAAACEKEDMAKRGKSGRRGRAVLTRDWSMQWRE